MTKISVQGPLVEIRGDETANVLFTLVRKQLIEPNFDVDLRTFDLSLEQREATADAVTSEAAAAVRQAGVAVKCSTITPNNARAEQFGLSQLWKSPNATLRKSLNGVIFREPVVLEAIPRLVPGWREPIVVARHANADQYQATDFAVPGAGTLQLTFTPHDGTEPVTRTVTEFGADGGVALGMYNNSDSIRTFARACFTRSLALDVPLYFSTKNTVLKDYDGLFVDIFAEVFEREFRADFAARGLRYEHRLIDDMVAFALKSAGGYLWALKNYDGDVQADIVAQGFGSPGLMASVLASADGQTCLFEAAHGTVARHFARWQRGERISTNPVATIVAWARAIGHRGLLDRDESVRDAAAQLERSIGDAVNDGFMTDDLATLTGRGPGSSTQEFIAAVAERFLVRQPRT